MSDMTQSKITENQMPISTVGIYAILMPINFLCSEVEHCA